MERKLHRSAKDKKICGVCGGLGEYFDIDPVFIRIVFLVALFTGSLGFWVYVIFAIVMPRDDGSYYAEEGHEVKRLYRSNDKKLFGVCSGLAEYFGFDVTLVRLATALLALVGFGLIFYIIAAIVMPKQEKMI